MENKTPKSFRKAPRSTNVILQFRHFKQSSLRMYDSLKAKLPQSLLNSRISPFTKFSVISFTAFLCSINFLGMLLLYNYRKLRTLKLNDLCILKTVTFQIISKTSSNELFIRAFSLVNTNSWNSLQGDISSLT